MNALKLQFALTIRKDFQSVFAMLIFLLCCDENSFSSFTLTLNLTCLKVSDSKQFLCLAEMLLLCFWHLTYNYTSCCASCGFLLFGDSLTPQSHTDLHTVSLHAAHSQVCFHSGERDPDPHLPSYSFPMVQWILSHWEMKRSLCSCCLFYIRKWWMFESNRRGSRQGQKLVRDNNE